MINSCNKPVVDLIFYVFRKTGKNHFNILFEAFKDCSEILVELHLIVARVTRDDSFNLAEIKSCLDFISSESSSGKNTTFLDCKNVVEDESNFSKIENIETG